MKEFEYPMWFKGVGSDLTVKFHSLHGGEIIVSDGTELNYVGRIANDGEDIFFVEHTNTAQWLNVTDQYKDKATIPQLKMWSTPFRVEEKAHNNGGSTDYYKLKTAWKDLADIMEDRSMNYNQGNIFKSAFCFNVGRHDGTSYERELNKIIYFAERELKRIKNVEA